MMNVWTCPIAFALLMGFTYQCAMDCVCAVDERGCDIPRCAEAEAGLCDQGERPAPVEIESGHSVACRKRGEGDGNG